MIKLIRDRVEEVIGCTVVGMAVMPLVSNQLAIYLSNYADKKWEKTAGQMLAYWGKVQTDAYACLMTAAVGGWCSNTRCRTDRIGGNSCWHTLKIEV